jgi:5-methylcytosine-specific restriction endonuclease McrA
MKNCDLDAYFASLRKIGMLLHKTWRGAKYKPLIGDRFRGREYVLASLFDDDSGLWAVTYYVVDLQTKFPLSFADNKAEALGLARQLLDRNGPRIWSELAGMARDIDAEKVAQEAAREQFLDDVRSDNKSDGERVRSIPRRRKQIFDASGGKCHYCSTPLTLDGKWHIEHKMPRALMGGNEPSNLVASCAPCNFQKRDTTDLEFQAKRAKGVS